MNLERIEPAYCRLIRGFSFEDGCILNDLFEFINDTIVQSNTLQYSLVLPAAVMARNANEESLSFKGSLKICNLSLQRRNSGRFAGEVVESAWPGAQ